MRFPKSVVQVRECGIALDIFYPVISVAQILARVSANADARALLFMFTQRVSVNAGEASRFRPGDFQPRRPISNKGLQMQTAFGRPRRHLSQKWEHGPRAPMGGPPAVRLGGGV